MDILCRACGEMFRHTRTTGMVPSFCKDKECIRLRSNKLMEKSRARRKNGEGEEPEAIIKCHKGMRHCMHHYGKRQINCCWCDYTMDAPRHGPYAKGGMVQDYAG